LNSRCSSGGFEALIERGIYSFVPRSGSANDWQDTYDQLATGSLADTAAGLLYRFPVEQRVTTFRRLCGELPAGARILDVGCGNGIFWQVLLDSRPAVGVDFSLEMCVQARARGMLAHQADALALPFGDAQFDLVYGAGLLEHIDDLVTVFAELARVSRPGGRVVVGSANKVSIARRVMRLLRRVKPPRLSVMRRPIVMRTVDELETAARTASLKLDYVCWTHLPFRWARYSRSAHNVFAPLASNVYTRFVRLPCE
jgi:SAM-dependent methyltransferase